MTDTNPDTKEPRMLTRDEEVQRLRADVRDTAYRLVIDERHLLHEVARTSTIGGV